MMNDEEMSSAVDMHAFCSCHIAALLLNKIPGVNDGIITRRKKPISRFPDSDPYLSKPVVKIHLHGIARMKAATCLVLSIALFLCFTTLVSGSPVPEGGEMATLGQLSAAPWKLPPTIGCGIAWTPLPPLR
ncbi:UNVERIFIED_CONTAM: hypothetical protein FKN15_068841 [Acipenser sinensis]